MQWSTVSDSPKTPLLSEEHFNRYVRDEYGRSGLIDFANMMELAKQKGCSAHGYSADEFIRSNHAGKGGAKLTKSQILEFECKTEAEFLEWSKQKDEYAEELLAEFGPKRRKK